MGVLQRFERRLEGLVEGTFAKVFGGVVQPVEIAAALQREAQDKKAIVGHGRVLVPNDYVVELGASDAERLGSYDSALRSELAGMLRDHAGEQGWSFVGPVEVSLEQVDDLGTGVFRVRSSVSAPDKVRSRLPPQGTRTAPGRPRLVLLSGGEGERSFPITQPVTVLGRGSEADVRVVDTGVSRRHAELHLDGDGVRLVDLQSTNGTLLNGSRVSTSMLSDGDRVELGTTALIYRQDE